MRCLYWFVDCISFLALLPYFRIYRRNTKEPILAIAREVDNEKVQELVQGWFRMKTQESRYVQVAVRSQILDWSCN
jgi:hypothetical protein